jgi:hypothetical protein
VCQKQKRAVAVDQSPLWQVFDHYESPLTDSWGRLTSFLRGPGTCSGTQSLIVVDRSDNKLNLAPESSGEVIGESHFISYGK